MRILPFGLAFSRMDIQPMDCNFLGLLVKGGAFVLALVVFELLFGVSSDEKQELKRILMRAKGKK